LCILYVPDAPPTCLKKHIVKIMPEIWGAY
jgi:hypothetical protein